MTKQCECCGKEIEIAFGSTKFCKKCSKYIFDLRKENCNLKHRLQLRNKRIEKLELEKLLK